MNLHAVVSGQIGAINPHAPLIVRVSTGYGRDAAFKQAPTYATPGAVVANFADSTMTVLSQTLGELQNGQTVAGAGVASDTRIVRQISGTPGGVGVYAVNRDQGTLDGVSVVTSFVVPGQVQPMGWKDLQQIEGLNLQGTIRKIYFYGQVEAIVRVDSKGGDLVTDPRGNIWLVNNVLEDWVYSGWCAVVATLQNGS